MKRKECRWRHRAKRWGRATNATQPNPFEEGGETLIQLVVWWTHDIAPNLWVAIYFAHLGPIHSDMDFTSSPRQEMKKKAMSTWPLSDGLTMGASSTSDRLMMSMDTQRGGASSSTRLQPRLASSSLDLIVGLGQRCESHVCRYSDRSWRTEAWHGRKNRPRRWETQQGHEKLRNDLADAK